MTKPYSNDLRQRAVDAIVSGETTRVVAERFGVAVSSVVKWHQRFRQTGSVTPGQVGGHRKSVLDPHRDFILDQIKHTPSSDLAWPERPSGQTGYQSVQQRGVAFPAPRGAELQKKHCSALNRVALMLLDEGGAGRA